MDCSQPLGPEQRTREGLRQPAFGQYFGQKVQQRQQRLLQSQPPSASKVDPRFGVIFLTKIAEMVR